MATYERLPRGKPKKPDEFISFFDKLYHKAYENGPMVIAVLAILAVVGLGTLFWGEFHKRKADKVAQKWFEATKQGSSEEQKVLTEIKKSNLYGLLGMWASLELADIAGDDCEKILQELDRYVGHGENEVLRSLIYLKVGVCLEDRKDFEKAEQVYQRGSSDSKNFLKDWSELRLAVVLQAQGKKDEAKKILEKLVQKDSTVSAPVKEQARAMLVGFTS